MDDHSHSRSGAHSRAADEHAGHAHDLSGVSDARLLWAVGLNQLLTVGQVIAGVLSGSLSLLADALHNFNDAMALLIAYVARRVSRRKATTEFTFGYRRAELIGAMINLTALGLVGLYLISEAVMRLIDPQPIAGWWMIAAAGLALAVDLATVALLWVMSQGNLNVRAAFVHNLTDAAASVAVLLGGVAVVYWNATWVDPVLTLLIAGYVLYQALRMLPQAARILMGASPPGVDFREIVQAMEQCAGVEEVHHVHIWQLDESNRSLEAHVVLEEPHPDLLRTVKRELKELLEVRFEIRHSTLEFEFPDEHPAERGHRRRLGPH